MSSRILTRNGMDEIYFKFFCGQWTLDRPQEAGVYPVCAIGYETTQMTLIVETRADGRLLVPSWSGWWWSQPFPPNFGLPKADPTVERRRRPSDR